MASFLSPLPFAQANERNEVRKVLDTQNLISKPVENKVLSHIDVTIRFE